MNDNKKTVIEYLSKGKQGIVFKVDIEDKKSVAVKIFPNSKETKMFKERYIEENKKIFNYIIKQFDQKIYKEYRENFYLYSDSEIEIIKYLIKYKFKYWINIYGSNIDNINFKNKKNIEFDNKDFIEYDKKNKYLFYTNEIQYNIIYMEYFDGISLRIFLNNIIKKEESLILLRDIYYQYLLATKEIYKIYPGFYHSDLHLGNIMVKQKKNISDKFTYKIKIIDYGMVSLFLKDKFYINCWSYLTLNKNLFKDHKYSYNQELLDILHNRDLSFIITNIIDYILKNHILIVEEFFINNKMFSLLKIYKKLLKYYIYLDNKKYYYKNYNINHKNVIFTLFKQLNSIIYNLTDYKEHIKDLNNYLN